MATRNGLGNPVCGWPWEPRGSAAVRHRDNRRESRNMSATLAQRAAELSAAAATGLPPESAAVFAEEQRRWREQSVPSGVVSAGDTLDDFTLPDARSARAKIGRAHV